MIPPSYKDLIARLPRTFGPSLNDQFRQWDFLFPAEQRQLQAQLDYLNGLPSGRLQQTFARIVELEGRMNLPRWQPDQPGLSIHDVGVLARSPLYPQWRAEVEKVFAEIDDAVAAAGAIKPWPRLVICILPAGLPLKDQPLWPDLSDQGKWIALPGNFSEIEAKLTSSLASRDLPSGLEREELLWVLECGQSLSALAERAGATAFSWSALSTVRKEFLSRLNTIRRDLKSADQTTEELRRLDLRRYLPPALNSRPRAREFLRALLLSGNGSLVFENSFVQWGASEALRRAQPQALIAAFGIRQKLKPFSSVVLFEDQNASNPVRDEPDPAGSLIDALFLSQYVYLSAQRQSAYQGRTLTLFAVEDLNRALLLGSTGSPPGGKSLVPYLLDWLSRPA